jgi:hypothetical protein
MENFETVTPAEREYFNSKGEKPIPGDEAATVEAEADEVEAVEPDEVEVSEPDAADDVETKDEASEEDKLKRKDSRIPLRKLQESENRRRELEKKLSEREQAFARADERLRMLVEAQQPRQEAPTHPDPKDDPIGAIEWQKQQLERIENERQRSAQEYQQQQQLAALDNTYCQSWSSFAGKQHDAIDAYNHFISVTRTFLDMQGVPQNQINQLIENEERKIAYAALQRGANPAEMIYERAKQMGYSPKAAAPVEDDTSRKAGEADIERRQKASSASKSLGAASGSRAGALPSFAELAEMSEDDYAEFRSKVGERQLRKLMGG